ncbi:MAG: hypothetical protein QXD29_00755 [Thermoplasmata archaeon]
MQLVYGSMEVGAQLKIIQSSFPTFQEDVNFTTEFLNSLQTTSNKYQTSPI